MTEELGWPTGLTLGITLLIALIWVSGSPQLLMANFPLALLGIFLMIVAVVKTRRWLVLICLPILLAPFYDPAALVIACFNGDCL